MAVAAPGAGCVRLHWVIGIWKVAPPGMLARVTERQYGVHGLGERWVAACWRRAGLAVCIVAKSQLYSTWMGTPLSLHPSIPTTCSTGWQQVLGVGGREAGSVGG